MKQNVTKLIVIAAALILCVLILSVCLKKCGSDDEKASGSADNAPVEEIENVEATTPGANGVTAEADKIAAGNSVAAGNAAGNNVSTENGAGLKTDAVPVTDAGSEAQPVAVPADSGSDEQATDAEKNVSATNPADDPEKGVTSASGQSKSSSRRDSAFPGDLSGPSADAENVPALFGGDDSYQYFEYQVITVPKKTLSEAAEIMGLPKDSPPSDELLPAIYKVGGYRVIGYSAGYSAARTPVEFKMSRTEFFPDFYILPNDGSGSGDDGDSATDDEGDDEEDGSESGDENSDDNADDNGDDGGDDEEDEDGDDGGYGPGDFNNSCNNLASILPFFGDPTTVGNEFFLDIRPPRIFSMESSLRKLSGFTNTDYGDWGEGQSPIFDDNSFSNALTATKGKPMIVAESSTSNAWTLHVFFTKALPMPERLVPAEGSENKLVRLDFQIVRAKWTDLMAAGGTDGCPGLPAETILEKLSKSNQLRDLYSPSFRVIPSQEPVTIQLNAKTQFVPLRWIPAQDYGVPAIPMNSEAIWTGTTLKAAARVLNDGNIVRLDYRFEKIAQTGWRNYGYSFYGEPAAPVIVVQQERYARPQSQQQAGPEIDTGLLKLPMIDTTAFRQALYLEVGKPVLAARISNPAYQPDMLTLLFVTATVEDAP